MTNETINRVISVACAYSVEFHCIVWLLSDGENLMFTHNAETREAYKNIGYWVSMIFENGHQVEA